MDLMQRPFNMQPQNPPQGLFRTPAADAQPMSPLRDRFRRPQPPPSPVAPIRNFDPGQLQKNTSAGAPSIFAPPSMPANDQGSYSYSRPTMDLLNPMQASYLAGTYPTSGVLAATGVSTPTVGTSASPLQGIFNAGLGGMNINPMIRRRL